MPTTPLNTGTDAVFRQLEAYNQRDADTFALQFSEDVKVYTYPNTLRYEGRETLREQYRDYFARFPALHCELLSRVRIGNVVIDEEHVLREAGAELVHAVAMYEVEEDLITAVRFILA